MRRNGIDVAKFGVLSSVSSIFAGITWITNTRQYLIIDITKFLPQQGPDHNNLCKDHVNLCHAANFGNSEPDPDNLCKDHVFNHRMTNFGIISYYMP